MNFDPVLYMESKKQNKKIKEENILKKEEIGISETASENKMNTAGKVEHHGRTS